MSEGESTQGQPQPRASVASVDARLARLETAQAEQVKAQAGTDAQIKLIQLEQQHMRELMNSRFTTIENGIVSQGRKLDDFIARIEGLMTEAMKTAGDLTATPVGRQVSDRLSKVETKQEIHETFIDQMKGMGTAMKWVIGSSILGLITGITSIVIAAQKLIGGE